MSSPRHFHQAAIRLLRWYPRPWRTRYEEEVDAVLEESPVTLKTLWSLFLGMLDAYLHRGIFTQKEFPMQARLRDSQVMIFSAFLLFPAMLVLFTFSYQYRDFFTPLVAHTAIRPLLRQGYSWYGDFWGFDQELSDVTLLWVYPGIGQIQGPLVRNIMNWCGVSALLTSLLAALWLVAMTVKQAWEHQRRGFLFMCASWPTSFFLLVGLWWLLVFRESDQFPTSLLVSLQFAFQFADILRQAPLDMLFDVIQGLLIAWFFGVGPLCLLLGARKATFSVRTLRVTWVLAFLTALAMGGLLVAKEYLALALALGFFAPLYRGPSLQLQDPLYQLSTLWIALLTAIAVAALWRGFQAQHKLKAA